MGRLLDGRVFDKETGKPLAFAVVAGTDANGVVVSPPEHATTNPDGTFRIEISKATNLGAKYTGYPRMVKEIIGNTDFDFPMKSGIELDKVTVRASDKKDSVVPSWLLWVGVGAGVLGIGFLIISKTKK